MGQGAPLRHDRATGPTGRCRASGSGACRCRSSSTGTPTRCIRTRSRCSSSPRRRSSTAASRPGSRRRTRTSASTATKYRKLTDTLDVWFDSGSTHQTVMGGPDGRSDAHPARTAGDRLSRPTSISKAPTSIAAGSIRRCSISCMLNGVPPYKALLTHGFTVDGDGRKMSKSKGNVVAPQKVSDTLGAEILRLWVAATDYSGDLVDLRRDPEARRRELPAHPQHAALPAREHQRLRSRRRDAVPVADLLEIDRYALAQAQALVDALPRRLRPLRVPPGRAAAADVLLRGSRAASISTC